MSKPHMKNAIPIGALAATLAISTACSVEHQRSVLGPTDVVVMTPTSAGPQAEGQSMIGTWVSAERFSADAITSLPPLSSCANFQWTVTSQTASQASGRLSALCPGGLNVVGTITGQLGGATIPLVWTGTATQGAETCSFSLNGVGVPLGNDTFQINYTGLSCLGPISGTERLRLASSAPAPAPTPAPAPAPSGYHVPPGPLTIERAQQVVLGTSREFPHLTATMDSEQAAVAGADQLLGRTIWHLQLAGFQAARQRNPSGLISSDKVSIFIDGAWHVYDIFSLGVAGRATRVQWIEVPLPNPVANAGFPD